MNRINATLLLVSLLLLNACKTDRDLPSIITVKANRDSSVSYILPVAYGTIGEERLVKLNTESVEYEYINKTNGVCFRSDNRLSILELSQIYNSASESCGAVPNWIEINYLCIKKAAPNPDLNISFLTLDENSTLELLKEQGYELEDLLRIPRACVSYSVPFRIGSASIITINTKAVLCRGHDKYSVRVFDITGRVIKECEDGLAGDLYIFFPDVDDDGTRDVCIIQDNHGEILSLVVKKE